MSIKADVFPLNHYCVFLFTEKGTENDKFSQFRVNVPDRHMQVLKLDFKDFCSNTFLLNWCCSCSDTVQVRFSGHVPPGGGP